MERIIQKVLKFLYLFCDPQEWYDICDREAKQVLYVRDDY